MSLDRWIQHDIDCGKVEHDENFGYLHGSNDDGPYDVDGVTYCGRCHEFIGLTPPPSGPEGG